MKTDNNKLFQLISNLEWQLKMGAENMVEEKYNNNSDSKKVKTNKDDLPNTSISQNSTLNI